MASTKFPNCPNCGGLLFVEDDSYGEYLTCLGCAISYNLDMTPVRMTPEELYARYGIKLTEQEVGVRIGV